MSYDPENSVVTGYFAREAESRRAAAREAADSRPEEIYRELAKLKCPKCGHGWTAPGFLREYRDGFFLDNDDDEFCPACDSDDALGVGVDYDIKRS